MKPPIDYLTPALLGQRVIEQLATTHQVKPNALRVLGLVHVLAQRKQQSSGRKLAQFLGCAYITACSGAAQCIAKGWLVRQETKGWGLRLTMEGARIVGVLERGEREARVRLQRAELPRLPRKYVRKAAV